MNYSKNVMATMTWTNEWLDAKNDRNIRNKEYLFLIQKTRRMKTNSNFRVKKIDIKNLAPMNQPELIF